MRCCLLLLLMTGLLGGPAAAQEDDHQRTALVVIDIQDFYFPGGALPLADVESAARNAGRVLQEFRKAGDLVVHVGHNASQGAAFHAEVAPEPGEQVFMKDEVNAFQGTGLLDYLQQQGVGRLVLVGMQTHMCLEAAVRAAHDFGFRCVVVQDACATRDLKYRTETIPARQVHLSTLKTLQGSYAEVVDTDAWLQKH
jgi:nicotinamidase-related amidase